MTWEPRGKDRTGAETWVGVTMGRTWLITRDQKTGVRLWRMDGQERVLHSVGLTSVEGAKAYVDRVTA